MENNDILFQAATYYKDNVIPYIFVLTVNGGKKIIFVPQKKHFMHLTGVQHLTGLTHLKNADVIYNYKQVFPTAFFRRCLDGTYTFKKFVELNDKGFSLIDEVSNAKEVLWFEQRVKHLITFLEVFEEGSYIDNKSSNIQNGSMIKSEYTCFKDCDNIRKCVFLCKEENRKIFEPISFICEDDYLSYSIVNGKKRFKIKQIEKYKKDELKELESTLKNNIVDAREIKAKNNQRKKINSKFTYDNKSINGINKKLSPNYCIKSASFGKGSVSLKQVATNMVIEKRFDLVNAGDNILEIVEYIYKHY